MEPICVVVVYAMISKVFKNYKNCQNSSKSSMSYFQCDHLFNFVADFNFVFYLKFEILGTFVVGAVITKFLFYFKNSQRIRLQI